MLIVADRRARHSDEQKSIDSNTRCCSVQLYYGVCKSPASQGKHSTCLGRRTASLSNHITKYEKIFQEEFDDAGGECGLGRNNAEEVRDVNRSQDAEVGGLRHVKFYPSCMPIMC